MVLTAAASAAATAWLRAQSDPVGNGHVYHVTYLAADAAGGELHRQSWPWAYPGRMRATPMPVDDGGRYDATVASVRPLFIMLVRK